MKNKKPISHMPPTEGEYYWVKQSQNSKFEPAEAMLDLQNGIIFSFTSGKFISIEAIWEYEPLIYQQKK